MTTTEPRDYSVDQMAVGFALGAALGLTPLLSLHNLVFLAAPIMLRLSISTFLIAWIGAIPFGFLLDPLFHRLGSALLSSELLTPLWIQAANAPLVPLTQFNNTVTLGSLVFWAVAAIPLFLLSRRGVGSYRGGLDRLLSAIPVVGAIGRVGIVRRLLGLEAGRRGWIRKGFVLPLAFFRGLGGGRLVVVSRPGDTGSGGAGRDPDHGCHGRCGHGGCGPLRRHTRDDRPSGHESFGS